MKNKETLQAAMDRRLSFLFPSWMNSPPAVLP